MNTRRIAFTVAKICFAAAVIAWLLHKVDASRVWNCVRNARGGPVLLGILMGQLTVVVAGWRWRRLLAIFEIRARLRSLICVAQIGQFFMMFLPGPAGDDLTRMLYISRLAKGRAGEACTSVVIDRFMGLTSILVFAAFGIPGQWHLLVASRPTYWLALGMLGACGVAGALGIAYFLSSEQGARRFFAVVLRLFPGARLHDEIERMTGLLWANKGSIVQVIIAAAGTQFLLCASYYLAGVAVGIHATPWVWFSFVPIVNAANAFPISVAGIGVREYLLVLFLGVLAHAASETALAASILVLGMTVVVCLMGGVVYIFYRPKQGTTIVV